MGIDNGQGAFYSSGYNVNNLSSGYHWITSVVKNEVTNFYVDGKYVGISVTYFGDYIRWVGNWHRDQNRYVGEIDEVRFWDKSLTDKEILVNTYTELTGKETNLWGLWKMNEGSF